MKSVKIAIASIVIFAAGAAVQAGVLSDSFDGNALDTSKWTVTTKTNSNASVQNGQLHLTYANGVWGSGTSIASQSLTFSGESIQFTLQKISYTHWAGEPTDNAGFHSYKIGLSSKAYIVYGHSKNKEYIQFYVDGNQVTNSFEWDAETLVPNNAYFGFRLTTTEWQIIKSTDGGVTYTVWRKGTFAAPISLEFTNTVVLGTGNAHGYGNDFVIDNVTLTTIPEAASLSVLGGGALALMAHRRR